MCVPLNKWFLLHTGLASETFARVIFNETIRGFPTLVLDLAELDELDQFI